MKKYLLLAFCLLSFSVVRAQVFTHTFDTGHIHVTVTDSMYHDSAYCAPRSLIRYMINIDSSYAGDTLTIIDTVMGHHIGGSPFVNTSGSSPWIFPVYLFTSASTDRIIPPGGGYAHVYHAPAKLTTLIDTLRYVIYDDSIWVTPCLYDTISGHIYIDNNTNCIPDAGDEDLNQIEAELREHLSSGYTTGDLNLVGMGGMLGYYKFTAQKSWLIDYTVSLPSSYAFIFPMSPCFVGPHTYTTVPRGNIDFPLLCSSNIDVQCDLLSTGRVRLYDPFIVHPYVSNIGCDTVSGTMTLVKDSRVIYNPSLSTHPADTVRGDTLIWVYSHLSNLSSGGYWNSFMSDVYLTQDTTVSAGDTLCFRVYANIPSADVNPYNNERTLCIPVVYSFDPNSKEVMPAGTGTDGQLPANTNTLTYTINFQNTGTDVAYDVRIVDTLDSDLDPQSLRILGTSHNMTPNWLASNVVEFKYNNIMLPDSNSNEPGSHGQVRFSIKLKPGLAVGTQIRNTGYIYFDLNPPVITNTTYSTTTLPSAVPQVNIAKNTRVYPNPATDQINIEDFGAGEISVLNMSGAVLISQQATGNKTVIDISRLPGGVYMIRTVGEANTSTIRFTKY